MKYIIVAPLSERAQCYHVDMGNNLESLGERVKLRRGKLSLSQKGLAALISKSEFGVASDYHQTGISAIENGSQLPSVQVLAALAHILETNTDYLLGLTDDDKPVSDLEDQVVVGVRDPAQRAIVQELIDTVVAQPPDDQAFILAMVRKVAAPLKPRIIGQES